MAWCDGRLVNATIRSILGNPGKVRLGEKVVELKLAAGQAVTFDASLLSK